MQPTYRSLITEGAETRNMRAAKHYLYDKMGYSEQQAMQFIGKVKTDIPNSRLGKCKFMLAICRMFNDGQLNDGHTVMNVNKCLKYAASQAHIDEYDQNLNGFTAEQLIQKFSGAAQGDLEQDKADVGSQQYDESGSQYEIVKIMSFSDAEEYGDYVDWCVTHYEDMFNSYTSNGNGVFYFCLRNGWEDEPEEKGEGCPLDSYGLSMIAVSVNNDGSCNTITCRWNHDNGGNDNIMTPKQLSEVIGRNFYEVFKPLTPQEIEANMRQAVYRVQDEIESQMWNGEGIEEIAECMPCDPDYGDKDECDVYRYKTEDGQSVLLDEDGQFIIERVFDAISFRVGDVLEVMSGNKYNFLTTDGRLLSETWYDKVRNEFNYGYGMVCRGKKWNLINKEGKLIFDDWYDSIGNGSWCNTWKDQPIVQVIKDGKINYVRISDGSYVFDKPIAKQFRVDAYNNFIKFEGDDFYTLYDPNTFNPKAGYKVKTLLGYYDSAYYKVELTDGGQYYMRGDGSLLDINTKQVVYDARQFNQQPMESRIRFTRKDLQEVLINSMAKILGESWEDEPEETEIDPVEEYENDYPNGGFDPKSVDINVLTDWVRSVGDFLYIINSPFRGGYSLCAANTQAIVDEIVDDLNRCSYVEPTHEVDYVITRREREFVYDYVAVLKVVGAPGEDYYIVYQTPK